ncbi:MAG: hypothetical protein K8963_06600, partial [Proteobacteria bacterium]|nr:hypothetical protein [Pseudomonadota bacterium]
GELDKKQEAHIADSEGVRGGPKGVFGFFFFFRDFLLVFMGIRRTCGHAITPCDSLSAQLTVP